MMIDQWSWGHPIFRPTYMLPYVFAKLFSWRVSFGLHTDNLISIVNSAKDMKDEQRFYGYFMVFHGISVSGSFGHMAMDQYL